MDSKNLSEKKYGLIIPSKGAKIFLNSSAVERKPTVFAADSSSDDNLEDDDDGKQALDWRSRTVAKAAEKSMQRNQAREAARKALEEDPTVFQYDELYDEMEQKRAERKEPAKKEKKPKYIENLLKTAELRKVEQERRTERKVQKERELEGDKFQDKEAFVTPAYRAKLEELKKTEEEERRKDQLESLLDVTKQKDMSGFYRHLYRQTFADNTEKMSGETKVEEIKIKDEPEDENASLKAEPRQKPANRQYRQRRDESPEASASDAEIAEEGSGDIKEAAVEKDKRPAASAALVAAAASDRAAVLDRHAASKEVAPSKDHTVTSDQEFKHPAVFVKVEKEDSSNEESDDDDQAAPPVIQLKIKVDIWKKRTTGEVLQEAIERYLMRKESREQGLVSWP